MVQLDESTADFRRRMIEHLVDRLEGDTAKAQIIETFLFCLTPVESLTRTFGSDHVLALNHALTQLFVELMDRHVRQLQINHQADVVQRHAALKCALGARFDEGMNLLHRINIVKLQTDRSDYMSPYQSYIAYNYRLGWVIPDLIPNPAEQLLFHNSLCAIAETAPLDLLNDQDWDHLIDEGKEDLNNYVEWSRQSQCSERIQSVQDIEDLDTPGSTRARKGILHVIYD